ncbi:MAG: LiaI-LiaF-like domain-containing protein [Candidatus Zixiibacteriota bacterium]
MTPSRFRWGIFLVLLGVLLLMRNFDLLEEGFWSVLIVYWPVILIAVGVEKIFASSRLRFLSYLTSVALFGGAVYLALGAGAHNIAGDFFSESTIVEDYDPSVKHLRAVLDLEETDLTVRDAGSAMLYGRFDEFTAKPAWSTTVNGELAVIELTAQAASFLGGIVKIHTDRPQDWYLQFCDRIPLELECSGTEADIHLNLATTPLDRLKLDADDSRVYLKLGSLRPEVRVIILGEDSDVRLRVPLGIGLKVSGDEYQSLLERIGLVQYDGGFVNEGYDTLSSHIDVDLDERLSSFSLDFF